MVRVFLILLAAGAVAALGLAPVGLWPLTLGGLAVGLGVISGAGSPRQAAIRGWWLGAGWFGLGLSWIVEPFLVDIARHGWMAPFALVFMAGGLALFWGLAGYLGARISAPLVRPFATAVCLAGAEYLRSVVLTGFPWNLVGHVWIGTGVDLFAAVLGAHGLTLMTCLIAAGVVAASRSGAASAGLSLAVAVAAGWVGGGALMAAHPAPVAAGDAPVVRLIQPNAPQDEKWDPAHAPRFLARQLGYTAAPGDPDLIVWPETAIPVFLEYPGTVLEEMADAAGGTPLVFGAQSYREPRYFNSLAVMVRGGLIPEIYDKHHLVPFGEYIPLTRLADRLGIRVLADTIGSGFSAGPGPRVIDLPGIGPALPLICYEGIFPHELGRYERRPRLMVLITNDAWFGQVSGPYQHLAQARLRSIEQGLPMVRVANTGVSAMIDARGGLIDPIPLGEAGFRDVRLPGALPPTLYARWGDWPMIVLLLAAIGGFAAYPRSKAD